MIDVTGTAIWRAIQRGILPASRRGKAYFIAEKDLLDAAPFIQGRGPGPKETKKPVAGDLAGECFDRFAKGIDPISVIRELRQDPDVVDRLWDRWLMLQKKFVATRPTPCVLAHKGPCSGPPSMAAMLCALHAETATVLTPEEESLLCSTHADVAERVISTENIRHAPSEGPVRVNVQAQGLIAKAKAELGLIK